MVGYKGIPLSVLPSLSVDEITRRHHGVSITDPMVEEKLNQQLLHHVVPTYIPGKEMKPPPPLSIQ